MDQQQLHRNNPFQDGDDDDYDDLRLDITKPPVTPVTTSGHHQAIMSSSYDEVEAAEKRTMEDVSKMKEWVSLKLKELEDQNLHLKEENRKFNEELAKLKQSCCITSSSTSANTTNSIKSKKNKKAFTPEITRRRFPSSRQPPDNHLNHHYQNSFELQQQNNNSFRQGFESASSQRRQPRRRYISVENVVDGHRFSGSSNSSSSSSSTTSSDEEEFFVTKSRYARHLKNSLNQNSRYQHQSPTRSRALRNAAQPRIEGAHMTLLSGQSRQISASASNRTGSLDRKLTRMRRLNFTELKRQQQQQQKNQLQKHRHRGETKQQQLQQRKQLLNADLETTTSSSKVTAATTKVVDHDDAVLPTTKPPTPPLHRCPSWESRIYEVANQGIRSAISTPVAAVKHFNTTANEDGNGNNHHHTASNDFFGDGHSHNHHHLPLFKNINGRLAKISDTFTTSNLNNTSSRMTASFDENCSMNSSEVDLFDGVEQTEPGETLFTTSSCLQTTSSHLNTNSNTSSGNESDFRPHLDAVDDDAISLEDDEDSDQDDYALPPDAMMADERPKTPQRSASTRAPGTSLAGSANILTNCIKPSSAEKSGYLLKLSGKGRFVRTWKHRWFVLKDGGHLSYYRSEKAYLSGESPSTKTATPIYLEPSSVRIHRPADSKDRDLKSGSSSLVANTFQLHYSITAESGKKSSKKKKKVLTLSADCRQTLTEWLRLLNQTLTANGIYRLLQANEGAPPSIEGPLVRVRLGVATKLWAALYGQHLVYFLTSSSGAENKTPLGYTALKGAKVQQIESFEEAEVVAATPIDHTPDLSKKKDVRGRSTPTPPPPSLATPTLTISIHPATDNNNEPPVYLRLPSKQQYEQWACQLKHAASPSYAAAAKKAPPKRTLFEEALSTLRSLEQSQTSDEDFYSSSAWNAPALCYSEDASLAEPLSSLPSAELRSEALKLFKALQLFISVPLVEVVNSTNGSSALNSPAIDYHVALAQNVLKMGLEGGQVLQTELLLQLIKQSSPEGRLRRQVLQINSCTGNSNSTISSSSNSPFHFRQLLSCASASAASHACNSNSPSQKSPPSPYTNECSVNSEGPSASLQDRRKYASIFLQCFQLLALAISIFQPRGSALWLLRHHLKRSKTVESGSQNGSSEIGQLALYCERALARVLQNGPRRQIASRMEVLSILQRNPNKHSMPHSIPVHFAAGAGYQVVGFDGSSTVAEFVQLLNSESGIREGAQSGFALYGDDPLGPENGESSLYLLNPQAKLADVIAHWECTLRKYHLGKFESTRAIKLVYRHRLCLRRSCKNETDRERFLWVWEINEEVVAGRFPVTVDLAMQLATLLLQIELGDCPMISASNSVDAIYQRAVEQFLPRRFLFPEPEEEENEQTVSGGLPHLLREVLFRRWAELRGRSALDCVRIYLNCTRRWPLCGARLFPVRRKVASAFKYDDLASLQLCKLFGQHPEGVWLAVAEEATELLELGSMRPLLRIPHRALITFGGHRMNTGGTGGRHQQQYLMLLVNGSLMEKFVEEVGRGGEEEGAMRPLKAVPFTEGTKQSTASSVGTSPAAQPQRMLFSLSKRAIVEVTMLLADYISLSTMSSTGR